MRFLVWSAAGEERVARDGREARRRRRLPRLREDLAQQRQHVDEGVVVRVRERLEQVKSPPGLESDALPLRQSVEGEGCTRTPPR